MFSTINTIGSGMTASQERLEVTSNNITNMDTTRTANGGPYHRQSVLLESKNSFDSMFNKSVGSGVEVKKIVEDPNERLEYDPKHPDADEEGYVHYPEINIAAEMTDMMQAQRSYEANVTAFNAAKKVMQKTQEIGRV